MSASIVTYDNENRELRTVVVQIGQRPSGVELISYRPGIELGARIQEGTPIADIYWIDGTLEVLKAPQGCGGTVVFINQHIPYHLLSVPPSQVLLRLS